MKKFLVFLAVIAFMLGNVFALSTSTSLGVKGLGTAAISTEQVNSATHSAKLSAPFDNSQGPEGRVHIQFTDTVTLGELNSISWMQYVTQGYIAHVDVLLDLNENGNYDSGTDDALVFEYDKVKTPSDQLLAAMNFGKNSWVNTFSDKGIVDGNAIGWLNSGDSGGVNSPNFIEATLAQWKAGGVGTDQIPAPDNALVTQANLISGTTKVLALEIEIDGWIDTSQAYIDDIKINDLLIEDFENNQQVNGDLADIVSILVSPGTLDFGSIPRGIDITDTDAGPITIDTFGSDTESNNVYVYADVTGADNAF